MFSALRNRLPCLSDHLIGRHGVEARHEFDRIAVTLVREQLSEVAIGLVARALGAATTTRPFRLLPYELEHIVGQLAIAAPQQVQLAAFGRDSGDASARALAVENVARGGFEAAGLA